MTWIQIWSQCSPAYTRKLLIAYVRTTTMHRSVHLTVFYLTRLPEHFSDTAGSGDFPNSSALYNILECWNFLNWSFNICWNSNTIHGAWHVRLWCKPLWCTSTQVNSSSLLYWGNLIQSVNQILVLLAWYRLRRSAVDRILLILLTAHVRTSHPVFWFVITDTFSQKS